MVRGCQPFPRHLIHKRPNFENDRFACSELEVLAGWLLICAVSSAKVASAIFAFLAKIAIHAGLGTCYTWKLRGWPRLRRQGEIQAASGNHRGSQNINKLSKELADMPIENSSFQSFERNRPRPTCNGLGVHARLGSSERVRSRSIRETGKGARIQASSSGCELRNGQARAAC